MNPTAGETSQANQGDRALLASTSGAGALHEDLDVCLERIANIVDEHDRGSDIIRAAISVLVVIIAVFLATIQEHPQASGVGCRHTGNLRRANQRD